MRITIQVIACRNGISYRNLGSMRGSRTTSATVLRAAVAALTLSAFVLPNAGAEPGGAAEPLPCNSIACLPGVTRGVVKGSDCADPNYHVFAVTVDGQLFFCGSPRGFTPRYFRSPQLAGVRRLGDSCEGEFNQVAQAPDGLYLLCAFSNADELSHWAPGNYSDYRKAY